LAICWKNRASTGTHRSNPSGSENPRGAVNQQERPDCKSGILRDLTPGFKEIALLKMIKSDLHGDMQEKFYEEFFARDAPVSLVTN
jgi:hypothetical protein